MKKLLEHNHNGIDATIIADSIYDGERLTTFVVSLPRIVIAEFNTHRVFSRNSASSRAIPFGKMLERVQMTPFIPIAFQKDHSGMQGTEYFEGVEEEQCKKQWLVARDKAVEASAMLSTNGVTKQLCNRLLEPFLWHTVIVTSSDYENFFAIRAHEAAEIHIAKLAEIMLEQYNTSKPKELNSGEWHIPFGDMFDMNRIDEIIEADAVYHDDGSVIGRDTIMGKIAVARCARVSYMNFEGKDDYEADIKLFDRLSKMKHFSPFEHVAMANINGSIETKSNFHEVWHQLRKGFGGENSFDDRVVKHG